MQRDGSECNGRDSGDEMRESRDPKDLKKDFERQLAMIREMSPLEAKKKGHPNFWKAYVKKTSRIDGRREKREEGEEALFEEPPSANVVLEKKVQGDFWESLNVNSTVNCNTDAECVLFDTQSFDELYRYRPDESSDARLRQLKALQNKGDQHGNWRGGKKQSLTEKEESYMTDHLRRLQVLAQYQQPQHPDLHQTYVHSLLVTTPEEEVWPTCGSYWGTDSTESFVPSSIGTPDTIANNGRNGLYTSFL